MLKRVGNGRLRDWTLWSCCSLAAVHTSAPRPRWWWCIAREHTGSWWRGITCFRCWFDGASARSVAYLNAPRHGYLGLDSLSGRDELMMMLPRTCRGLVCIDTMFGCCCTVYRYILDVWMLLYCVSILCILFWMLLYYVSIRCLDIMLFFDVHVLYKCL